MWTIKFKIFERGTDLFLRPVDFTAEPSHLIELLGRFTLGPKNWAHVSAINPAGIEKGFGIITDVNTATDMFKYMVYG